MINNGIECNNNSTILVYIVYILHHIYTVCTSVMQLTLSLHTRDSVTSNE